MSLYTRIDFRLIHGQVMTRWAKTWDLKKIVVIDDVTAKSGILKKIVLSSAPNNIKTDVLTLEEGVEDWKKDKFGSSDINTLVIFKDTSSVSEAYKLGINLPSIQIGGIEGSSNKKNIFQNIVMSKEDVDLLKPLYESGVEIYCQVIPENSKMTFEEVLKKF